MKRGYKLFQAAKWLLLAAVFAFALTGATAKAAIVNSGVCGKNGSVLTWALDDAGKLTISGGGEMVDRGTNLWGTEVVRVVIEDGVTSIGAGAFSNCGKLTNITIPNTVKTISSNSFENCISLKEIVIPDGVTSIADWSFFGCRSLKRISIPSSVTSIGMEVFRDCISLTDVEIPNGVTSIGDRAFPWCTGLKILNIPQGVTSIGGFAFGGCTGLTEITIANTVTSIGASAFSQCDSLKSISLPNSVTSIADRAFYFCQNLVSVTLPDTVTGIGSYAFSRCKALADVMIPDGVISIASNAFSSCESLVGITIPSSVTKIDDCAFRECLSLERIEFLGMNTSFGSDVAGSASNASIKPTVYCYMNSDADTWAKANDYPRVYLDASQAANTRKIALPSVYQLGYGYQARIVPSVVPSFDHPSVTWASSAPNIVSVNNGILTGNAIGTAVITATADEASASMTVSVYKRAESFDTPAEIWIEQNANTDIARGISPSDAMQYLSWSSTDASVASVDQNGKISGITPGDASVTVTDVSGILRRTIITQISLPSTVTSIESYAFSDCSALTFVDFSSQLTKIGNYAFLNCGLQQAVLPDALEEIGFAAFAGCGKLQFILFPDNLKSIDASFFSNISYPKPVLKYQLILRSADSATAAVLSEAGFPYTLMNDEFTVTPILTGDQVTGQLLVKSARYIPAGVTEIGENAFTGSTITTLTIPGSVTRIHARAFSGCDSLAIITLADEVSGIDADSFAGCSANLFAAQGSQAAKALSRAGYTFHVSGLAYSLRYLLDGDTVTGTVLVKWKLPNYTGIKIPEDITDLADGAFSDCASLKTLTFHDGEIRFGPAAFPTTGTVRCVANFGSPAAIRLSKIDYPFTVPNGELRLKYAFEGSDPDTITGLIAVGPTDYTLRECVLPDGVTRIEDLAFLGCRYLASVTLPDTLKEIGERAFSACAQLTALALPSGITDIASDAFTSCPAALYAEIGSDAALSVSKAGLTFYAPGSPLCLQYTFADDGTAAALTALSCSDPDVTELEVPKHVTALSDNLFKDYTSLMAVTLPDSLAALPAGAFSGCTALTRVSFPEGLTEIGENAFNGCAALNEAALPENLTAVGARAFYNCSALSALQIPQSLTDIGDYAFYGCTAVEELDSLDQVTSIGTNALPPDARYLVSYGTPIYYYLIENESIMPRASYSIRPYTPSSITILSPTEVVYGKSGTLSLAVTPSDLRIRKFASPEFTYASSDESILTVSDTGIIRGVNPGIATVYVADRMDPFMNVSRQITVVDKREAIPLDLGAYAKFSYSGGKTAGLQCIVLGGTPPYTVVRTISGQITNRLEYPLLAANDATEYFATPKLTDKTVFELKATVTVVDATGKTASATTSCGVREIDTIIWSGPKKDYVSYVTYDPSWGTKPAMQMSAIPAPASLSVGIGDEAPLVSELADKLIFFSNDPTVATVSEDGIVTGRKVGNAVIRIYSIDGSALEHETQIRVVGRLVQGIGLTAGENVEGMQQLSAVVLPESADDRSLLWSSSDESIATVDDNGLVAWHAAGNVTITAAAVDGSEISQSLDLSWEGILMQQLTLAVDPDCPSRLIWTAIPANTTNRNLTFKVDKPWVLEITALGYLHFLQEGSVTIRATAADGSGVTADLAVSGNPEHAHVPLTLSAARLSTQDQPGLSPKVLCAVCGETLRESQSIPAGSAILTLPKAMQTIRAEAFYGLTHVMQIAIPEGTVSIGSKAFADCGALLVYIPETVTDIAEDAFEGCNQLCIMTPSGSEAATYAHKHQIALCEE